MEDLNVPPIIIATASEEMPNQTDVEFVLDFIERNKIPVYVFTYSNVNNIELSKLVKFGGLFTGKLMISFLRRN